MAHQDIALGASGRLLPGTLPCSGLRKDRASLIADEYPLQVIIGSYPHGDGTFDKANDFQSVVVDGAWTMGLATAKLHAGQVAYIVPAAKGRSSCLHTSWACLLSWVPLPHN